MPEVERRPVLRGFQEPDHDRGVELRYHPTGRADADPAKEPCSIYEGPIAHRWYVEDDPNYERVLTGGAVVKGVRVGSDGAGPLLGPPLLVLEDDPPVSRTKSKPAGTDTQEI